MKKYSFEFEDIGEGKYCQSCLDRENAIWSKEAGFDNIEGILSLNFILKPLIKAYKWFKGLFKSKVYLNYKPYIKKMAFIEMFYFQQRCRLESIKNM